MYVFAICTSLLLPRSVNRYLTNLMSLPFTLAFSNTPGILRQLDIGECKLVEVTNAVVPGGRIGICITCLSFAGSIRITCLSDTGILDQPGVKKIVLYMEEAIAQLSKVKID